MDKVDVHEFISECEHVLNQREADPLIECWFCGEGDDEGLSYCEACIHALRPNAEKGEDYLRAYPPGESDGRVACEECSRLLQYTLTNYGLEEQLEYFKEDGWDWNNPQDCYELNRVVNGVCSDEDKRRLVQVLKRGLNPPDEIAAAIKTSVTRRCER